MTTPNGEYVKNSLPSFSELGEVQQYAARQFTADGDGHFFAYRSREMTSIFEQAGLDDVCAYCFETPFISGHMKVRYAHSLLSHRLLSRLDRLILRTPKIGNWLAHQMMIMGKRA